MRLTHALRRLLWLPLGLALIGCDRASVPLSTGPSALASAAYSVADLPPLDLNPALSCPSAAPTQFSVTVNGANNDGNYKVDFTWRRTGVNVTTYLLEMRRRFRNDGPLLAPTFATLDGGVVHTRYLAPGIYHFRVRANCDPAALWTAEVVKNVGVSANPPDLTPPPPPPPVPECEPEIESLARVATPCEED